MQETRITTPDEAYDRIDEVLRALAPVEGYLMRSDGEHVLGQFRRCLSLLGDVQEAIGERIED